MNFWQSKKWILFGGRPTSLLKRQFRKNWYLWVGNVSRLRLSTLLIIGEKDNNFMFVKRNEDGKNYQQAKQDYKSRLVDRNYKKFLKIDSKVRLPDQDSVERALYSHRHIGPILVYTHYIERLLTKKSQRLQKLNKEERNRIRKLIRQTSQIRNGIVKLEDRHFLSAYQYLKKKYCQHRNIDWYLLQELAAGQRLNAKQLEARRSFFVQLAATTRTKIYSGRRAYLFLKKEGFRKVKVSAMNKLKGISAFPGQVAGRVAIVAKLSDLKGVNKNSIIVSPMTVVEYVPCLKKVKAIITNEGGLTCHAAITAREFKIPCVVGTEVATQVLRDGDKVEVDATKGVIKKL